MSTEKVAATILGLREGRSCSGCGGPIRSGPDGAQDCPACGMSTPDSAAARLEADEDAADSDAAIERALAHPDLTRQYRIVRRLGPGGMGAVFLAEQRELERPVALKLMLASSVADRERFRREGQILAQLSHPNVLRIFAVEFFGDTPALVLELLEGRTLRADLRQAGRYPPPRVREVGLKLLEGLSAAHKLGIVHRDLKTDNVLLLDSGAIKILDFGLARRSRSAEASGMLTQAGTIMGTPAYMSPEQCEGRPVDARTDLYSLGVILFELTCARLPFAGAYPMEILLKQIKEDPPPVSSLVPEVPLEREQVIRRALSKNADDRFADTASMSRALAQVPARSQTRRTGKDRSLAPEGGAGRPGGVSPTSPRPRTAARSAAVAPSGRPPFPALVVLGAMLTGVVVAGVLAARRWGPAAGPVSALPPPRSPAAASLAAPAATVELDLSSDPPRHARLRYRLDRPGPDPSYRVWNGENKVVSAPLHLPRGEIRVADLEPGQTYRVEILHGRPPAPLAARTLVMPRPLVARLLALHVADDHASVSLEMPEPASLRLRIHDNRAGQVRFDTVLAPAQHHFQMIRGLAPSTWHTLELAPADPRRYLSRTPTSVRFETTRKGHVGRLRSRIHDFVDSPLSTAPRKKVDISCPCPCP